MKHLFSPKIIKIIFVILLSFVGVKIVWFGIAMQWLPAIGINHQEAYSGQKLYYRVKLTPNKRAKPIKQPVKNKVKPLENMRDITLLAIYHDSHITVVTVEYRKKTKILSTGDTINGFTLEDATKDFALFSKSEKSYQLQLLQSKNKKAMHQSIASSPTKSTPKKALGEVIDAGDHKIIEKSVFEHYTKNMDEIYKNIGIVEVKEQGTIIGFKLTFVRKGTLFSQLGVQRGDIIKSVNGEKLTSYNAAFKVYQEIQNTENITLQIERNKEEMELEYEIN